MGSAQHERRGCAIARLRTLSSYLGKLRFSHGRREQVKHVKSDPSWGCRDSVGDAIATDWGA